jgi:hypothetical protein
MRFVPVTTATDAGSANVIKGVLQQAGIEAAIGGTGMEDVYPTPFVNPLEILVEVADEERARAVLAQYDTIPQDADEEE